MVAALGRVRLTVTDAHARFRLLAALHDGADVKHLLQRRNTRRRTSRQRSEEADADAHGVSRRISVEPQGGRRRCGVHAWDLDSGTLRRRKGVEQGGELLLRLVLSGKMCPRFDDLDATRS